MPTATRPWFTSRTLAFLRDLAKNNDRDWFAANKERYEEHVLDPALRFVADFAPRLERVSPRFVADPRRSGGSLFRIHRDTRFAKDKSPYKTFVGIRFGHDAGRDVHAPCFYLHVEPKGSFAGMGIWRPDAPTLKRVRDALVADPAAWKRAAHGRKLRGRFELGGESLKRPPRGYDPDHPLARDLRRKDFTAGAALADDVVTSPKVAAEVARAFQAGAPLVRFLCDATGLPF